MENQKDVLPVLLVNKTTGDVYEHLKDHDFMNLTSRKIGTLKPESAKKSLVMPIRLNYLADKNRAVLELIRTFGLSVAVPLNC